MRVVVPAVIVVGGMYAFALFGPLPFTTSGLLLGIAIVFGVVMAAMISFHLLDRD